MTFGLPLFGTAPLSTFVDMSVLFSWGVGYRLFAEPTFLRSKELAHFDFYQWNKLTSYWNSLSLKIPPPTHTHTSCTRYQQFQWFIVNLDNIMLHTSERCWALLLTYDSCQGGWCHAVQYLTLHSPRRNRSSYIFKLWKRENVHLHIKTFTCNIVHCFR